VSAPAPGTHRDTQQHRTWVSLGYCPYIDRAGTWCSEKAMNERGHTHWAWRMEPGGQHRRGEHLMALAEVVPRSPLLCYTDAEWFAYIEGMVYERSVHYAPSSMRRQFGVTDAAVSACLDCELPYQREMLLLRRCRPPAHVKPITPLERLEAGG
jgi:hypothetical protein